MTPSFKREAVETLLHSDGWQVFLGELQARRNEDTSAFRHIRTEHELQRLQGGLDVLDWVLGLPADLTERLRKEETDGGS